MTPAENARRKDRYLSFGFFMLIAIKEPKTVENPAKTVKRKATVAEAIL